MRVRIGDVVGVLMTAPTMQGKTPVYVTAPAVVTWCYGLGGIPCAIDLEMIGGERAYGVRYAALAPGADAQTWHLLPPPDRERVPA